MNDSLYEAMKRSIAAREEESDKWKDRAFSTLRELKKAEEDADKWMWRFYGLLIGGGAAAIYLLLP